MNAVIGYTRGKLIKQWLGEYFGCVVNGDVSDLERWIATKAAEWGRTQRGAANKAMLQ